MLKEPNARLAFSDDSLCLPDPRSFEAGSKMQDRRDSSSLRVLHLIILRFDNNSGGSVVR